MSKQSLFHELAGTIGAAESRIIPLILEKLIDEKSARIALAASPPATAPELAEKTGYTEAEVMAALDDMFLKGMIYRSKKPDATRYYRFKHILQFHDANIVTPNLPAGVMALWREYNKTEWPATHHFIEDILPAPAARVIPVNESVSSEARVLPFDDISQLVNSASRIAVVNCTCRLVEGACGLPVENCIQLNKAADYTMERGTGREITREETFKILAEARLAGLVPVVDNRRSNGHIICNCCRDCCVNWPDPKNYRQKFAAPSRFVASVDMNRCTACETCVDRCFFDAITMNDEGDLAVVNEEKCLGCGVCQVTCEGDAISLVEKRAPEFVPE